jgi:hypothetical protein
MAHDDDDDDDGVCGFALKGSVGGRFGTTLRFRNFNANTQWNWNLGIFIDKNDDMQ